MNNPAIYENNSTLQRHDALVYIPQLISQMNWNGECSDFKNWRVLDFGCGQGFVTREILLPALNEATRSSNVKISGIDISDKMVEYARKEYSHQDIKYFCGDVTNDVDDDDDENGMPVKYDKIFSFYVLHHIPDYLEVLKKLRNLLVDGGEIGLYFAMRNCAVFSFYQEASKNSIWGQLHQNAVKCMPIVYNNSDDPTDELKCLLSSAGFHVSHFSWIHQATEFESLDSLEEWALTVNIFFERIPKTGNMRDNYRSEFRSFLLKNFGFEKDDPRQYKPVKLYSQVALIKAEKHTDYNNI